MSESKKKCHRNEDLLEKDDLGLLIKIELSQLSAGLFIILGTLNVDAPGIPSASTMIAFIAILKFVYFTWIVELLATEEHYSRYSSHNWYIKTDKFFRLLTVFALLGVGVFDVTVHETAHYAFVAMAVVFFGLSLLAAQGAIMKKEHEIANSRYSQLKKVDDDND